MHLSLKRLRTFPKYPFRFLHCEPDHLTHFSLSLNVAAYVKDGNMQVQ